VRICGGIAFSSVNGPPGIARIRKNVTVMTTNRVTALVQTR
jgi:hypothetical protein